MREIQNVALVVLLYWGVWAGLRIPGWHDQYLEHQREKQREIRYEEYQRQQRKLDVWRRRE